MKTGLKIIIMNGITVYEHYITILINISISEGNFSEEINPRSNS